MGGLAAALLPEDWVLLLSPSSAGTGIVPAWTGQALGALPKTSFVPSARTPERLAGPGPGGQQGTGWVEHRLTQG